MTFRRRACLTPLATALLLSGCVVGPKYRIPNDALIKSPSIGAGFYRHRHTFSNRPLPRGWWRLYRNPTLDGLVHQALTANTNLRMADADLQHSRALLREAKILREPGVVVQGGLEHGQLAGEQYLQPFAVPPNTYYDIGVTVGYDLDLFGAIRRGIQAAKAESQTVEAARDLVKVNVAAGTARAYVDACGAGLELLAAQRSLALQKKNLALTRELRSNGRATSIAVTRSRELADELSEAIPRLEAARRSALIRLATLTGSATYRFDPAIERCATLPRLTQPLPVADAAAFLERRPDIRQAERQFAAATAEVGVAKAQLYPDLLLEASLGSVGARADAFSSPTDFWLVGALLHWQANQQAARARIAGANASVKLALAHFDGVVLTALEDVRTAMTVYVHDLRRERYARASRDEAAHLLKQAERLQLAGRANSLEVVDAQRTLATAEQSLAAIETAVCEDQVAVFMALGGGWQPATTPKRAHGSTDGAPRHASVEH